jgi:hypothetical protein
MQLQGNTWHDGWQYPTARCALPRLPSLGLAVLARLLGIPDNTAKSYLHRARQLLHAMLSEKGVSCD